MKNKMRYYSVPSDFKNETIDAYHEMNQKYPLSKVVDTYGNITVGDFFGSGRLTRQMPKSDFFDLKKYIKYCGERDIEFNYTFNTTYLRNMQFTREGAGSIKTFLDQLYEAGVRSMTTTMPSITELVQSFDHGFKIRTSTLCQITNPTKALAYKKMGTDKIVVDESINKDFFTLKAIRDVYGENVEVIANQICDKNCIYRMFHYNMIAGDVFGTSSNVGINYFEHRCVLQQLKSIDNLLKLCWIRPEDVKHYVDIGIHYFKLQGRHTFIKGGDPVRTLKCYFEESFDGNLMDLLSMFANLTSFKVYVDNKKLDGFLKPFMEKENFCKNNCTKCKYCETFAKKCIDFKEAEEVKEMAAEFFDVYDQFKNQQRSIIEQKEDGTQQQKKNENVILLKDKKHDEGDFGF
ncbi:MAG: hypothetical protein GY757_19260 [bacterium]|nr:hypothetical protein [bacterium]